MSSPYTPDAVLDKLIAAGIGDKERSRISATDFARAMRGEIVRRKAGLHPECDNPKCLVCRNRRKVRQHYKLHGRAGRR